MRLSRPSPRSFTLIELLCVLAVVAVLAALVAPRLSASLRAGRLSVQARAVVALARKARALAASEGRTYWVVLDGSAGEARLVRQRDPLAPAEGEEPEWEPPSDAGWGRAVPFEDEVTLDEATLAEQVVDVSEQVAVPFAPNGSAQAASLVFVGPTGERLEVAIDGHLGLARVVAEEEAE